MIEIKHRYTREVLFSTDSDSLRGANLQKANLFGANLWEANLREANLQKANLRGVKYGENTQWPSPTSFLLASWGQLSPELTLLCMAFDASCHPSPETFDVWALGGPCPYQDARWQRACNFVEDKDLWIPDAKFMHPRPIDLALALLEECCSYCEDDT